MGETRRSAPRTSRSNPVLVSIICLLALVIVLSVAVIFLAARMSKANGTASDATKALETMRSEVDLYKAEADDAEAALLDAEDELSRLRSELEEAKSQLEEAEEAEEEEGPSGGGAVSSWLDLSGHSELKVKPDKTFDAYKTYYINTTYGLNLRSGPGLEHSVITIVDRGVQVQAAAQQGAWTLVKHGNRFGWVLTEYLTTTKPAASTGSTGSTGSGSSGGTGGSGGSSSGGGSSGEATSGDLNLW